MFTQHLQVDNSQFILDPQVESIHYVLKHWACPDPEIKLMSPSVFHEVNNIIKNRAFSLEDMHKINVYAPGVHSLIVFDGINNSALSANRQISDELVDLLRMSLRLSYNSLCVDKGVTRQYVSPYVCLFEEMVKTGSYFPKHPVIRTFPLFLYDFNNLLSKWKRTEEYFKKA